MKRKHLEGTKDQRDWRAEFEKTEIKYYRLTLKMQKLEKESSQKNQIAQIQSSLANTILAQTKETNQKKEDKERNVKEELESGIRSIFKKKKESMAAAAEKTTNKDLKDVAAISNATSIDGFTEGFDEEFGSPCPRPADPNDPGADKARSDALPQDEEKDKGEADARKMPADLWSNDNTAQYVEATLRAWNQCPSIVKKQLDEQHTQIKELREQLRHANMRISQKKNEFNRQAAVEMKLELQKHKDKIEQGFRKKFEEEKLKQNKQKVKELDHLMQENFTLKKQVVEFEKKNQGRFK